jgi:site-specific DNA-methyltransferase (adenine-specific)
MINQIIHGDCFDVLKNIPDSSIDLILTDPPYGLSFMGKDWDHGVPGVQFWIEALRVAKPGAHLFAFGGTRTFHRLAVAIEDAGWEIRDTIMWVYGSGFPKSLDVSKAIDKRGERLLDLNPFVMQ